MEPSSMCSVEGGRVAVYDSGGDGPTVVLVHGTPSAAFEFEEVIEGLGPQTRCVAVDHLGFGRSDKLATADYGLAAHQRRFRAVLDQLGIDDAVFVLHDFGTAIAVPWMREHPDRVRGVLLANTFLWPSAGVVRWVLAFYATGVGRWLYRFANLSVGVLVPWSWGTRRPLTPELHDRFRAPLAVAEQRYATSALPGELVGQTLAAMEPTVLRQWPVRAVWGLADPLVGAAELQRWAELLPGLPVTEVSDAGHFVAHEAPEVVVDAVRALMA